MSVSINHTYDLHLTPHVEVVERRLVSVSDICPFQLSASVTQCTVRPRHYPPSRCYTLGYGYDCYRTFRFEGPSPTFAKTVLDQLQLRTEVHHLVYVR